MTAEQLVTLETGATVWWLRSVKGDRRKVAATFVSSVFPSSAEIEVRYGDGTTARRIVDATHLEPREAPPCPTSP